MNADLTVNMEDESMKVVMLFHVEPRQESKLWSGAQWGNNPLL